MRLRLPIPSPTTLLAQVGDGLETATAVLGALTAFADELHAIAHARAEGVPYKRRDAHPVSERELTSDPRYLAGWADGLAGRQIGREQVAVGGGLPVQRRSHLSVVPDTPAGGRSA